MKAQKALIDMRKQFGYGEWKQALYRFSSYFRNV